MASGTQSEKVGTTVDRVSSALSRANKRSNVRARSESKRVGKSFHIRIFKKEKSVSADELATKLKPIIDGLKAEGRKSIVTMSPPTVAHLAHQLAKLLDEWTGDSPVQAHTGHGRYTVPKEEEGRCIALRRLKPSL
jgi:hypothetical protein